MASIEVEAGPTTLADVAISLSAVTAMLVAGSYMVDAMLWIHRTDVTSLFLSLFS
jgi:hypothetical protein